MLAYPVLFLFFRFLAVYLFYLFQWPRFMILSADSLPKPLEICLCWKQRLFFLAKEFRFCLSLFSLLFCLFIKSGTQQLLCRYRYGKCSLRSKARFRLFGWCQFRGLTAQKLRREQKTPRKRLLRRLGEMEKKKKKTITVTTLKNCREPP